MMCKRGWYLSWGKRAFDLVVVGISLPLWWPVMVFVALFVRGLLGAPVLFRQQRPGLGGRPFVLLKFRTMTDERDCAGRSLPDEQRLPRVGRILRRSSLDELPALLNVLRGEMSLVGPRPLLVQYLPLYSREQARRHEVLPGITGWAQVNGRNALSWEQKFRLDVYYVDHRSFWLDIRILALTVAKVLRRDSVEFPGADQMPFFLGSGGPTRSHSSEGRETKEA